MIAKEVQQVMDNLRRNRMAVDYVSTKAEVRPLVESLLIPGSTIASGGSQTLHETGVTELMHSGKYRYLDRNAPNMTDENRLEVIAGTAIADTYLCSSNAVTLQGELYNVDGNCNRISAIAFVLIASSLMESRTIISSAATLEERADFIASLLTFLLTSL